MSSRLIDSLSTTDPLAELFSDRSVLQAMLDFEAAVARAAARAGAIPEEAAAAITTTARAESFDAAAIARDARQSGTAAIPLVKALTERVQAVDATCARYVHWGATSQDVSDSALVLLLKQALPLLERDHLPLQRALHALSERHADSVMLGRTLLQPATPITFGLKVAGWYAALVRAWRRLAAAWGEALVVQFGGASGTLAALGTRSTAIAALLPRELDLRAAPPWHTDRDRLGALVTGCGLYTAALGKIARDVTLLMQAEVGEVAERGGGSSTMPHKRNPANCAVALAAATRMPGLVAAFLNGMIQEHERSVGGSHAEWPTMASVVQTTGAALASVAAVLDGLSVDPARMRANVDATGGTVLAERAVMLLAPRIGRDVAQQLVIGAIGRTGQTGGRLGEALSEIPEVVQALSLDELRDIDRAEHYLGAAESLRKALLGGAPDG